MDYYMFNECYPPDIESGNMEYGDQGGEIADTWRGGSNIKLAKIYLQFKSQTL